MSIGLILLGFAAGVSSGLFGIGGGIIIIPVLVYWFGLTQHQAQGTTLAILLLPIGLLAVWQYYQQGNVKVGMALLVALGFLLGGFFGAYWAHGLSDSLLKKLFGVLMLIFAIKMIVEK